MTILKAIEVVGFVCRQTGCPALYAKITVRVEPTDSSEYVNQAQGADFEGRFTSAALDGIRSVAQKYSWLTFRFVITDAVVHPVDSSERAFRMAGQESAKELFKRIYKRLTITAKKPTTKIYIADTEGGLVQAETGHVDTGLLQGNYDVFFGDSRIPVRIILEEDVQLQEGH
jgi:hypothetical protein